MGCVASTVEEGAPMMPNKGIDLPKSTLKPLYVGSASDASPEELIVDDLRALRSHLQFAGFVASDEQLESQFILHIGHIFGDHRGRACQGKGGLTEVFKICEFTDDLDLPHVHVSTPTISPVFVVLHGLRGSALDPYGTNGLRRK